MAGSSSRQGSTSSGSRGARGASSTPMSVEEITKEAQNFDYNPLIPLKYWLRSAGTLMKEAAIYENEGNEQQTYLLLFRHAQLVLSHLAQHPDVTSATKPALAQAKKDVDKNLAKLEVLKPRINKKYERYQKLVKDREAMGMKKASSKKPSLSSAAAAREGSLDKGRRRQDSIAEVVGESLAAGDNQDLAVQLARKEMKRRAVARKATRQAGIPEEVEHVRRSAGMWGNWEKSFANEHSGVDGDALSKQMQNIRLQVEGNRSNSSLGSDRGKEKAERDRKRPSYQGYNYPSVRAARDLQEFQVSPVDNIPERGFMESLSKPPPPPPKDDLPPHLLQPQRPVPDLSAPPKPAKQPLPRNNSSSTVTSAATTATPPSELDHVSTYTFKNSAYLENGAPLRTVFLPPDLRHRFVSIAASNTAKNIETCGILCGTLVANALFISRLVIPKQTATSDTCEMVDENALFDYVDGEDLLVLGWIHTHPTQTCFMSSRDLHTHAGYQVMMPESIAIVCAPGKQEWGIFRLTDPPGMQAILGCNLPGLFHPHSESNIYTDALKPGHVFEAGLDFEVHDMRDTK